MLKRVLPIVVVVLVANAAALAMVARNAGGSPSARVRLTEREVRLLSADVDSSALTLMLAWHEFSAPSGNAVEPWFTRAKLEAIGFDCSVDPASREAARHYSFAVQPARATFIVLDTQWATPPGSDASGVPGGPSVPASPTWPSRLHAVDVGNDASALRRNYPDRARYIVSAGTARIVFIPVQRVENGQVKGGTSSGRPVFGGAVDQVFPAELYVPTEWLAPLRGLARNAGRSPWMSLDHEPRYEVTVEYGQTLLPRVVQVRAPR